MTETKDDVIVAETKDVDKEFTNVFHTHGMGCGIKIAEIVKTIHSGAMIIIPLYRSCLVVEQSDEDLKEGDCTIHAYFKV